MGSARGTARVDPGAAIGATRPRTPRTLAAWLALGGFAFAFLPCYAAWRLYTALSGVGLTGTQPWVRTARGEPAQSELHPRP